MHNNYLAGPDYAKVIELTPVLCVDVILIDGWAADHPKDSNGEKYLLFKRNNEPLKGENWVIGGRVFKGELLIQAAIRKVFEETRLMLAANELTFVGYYEEQFKFSSIGRGPYHTVSIVYEATVDKGDIQLDSQHSGFELSAWLPKAITANLIKDY